MPGIVLDGKKLARELEENLTSVAVLYDEDLGEFLQEKMNAYELGHPETAPEAGEEEEVSLIGEELYKIINEWEGVKERKRLELFWKIFCGIFQCTYPLFYCSFLNY